MRPLRVGFDLRPLQGETQFRGIGKSLAAVLAAMDSSMTQDLAFTFYVDTSLETPKVIEHFENKQVIAAPVRNLGKKRFVRSVIPAYPVINPSPRSLDAFVQFDAALGVPWRVPTLAIFYDMIPLLFRERESKSSAARGMRRIKNTVSASVYWQRYIRSLGQYQNAREVAAISHASLRDFERYITKHPTTRTRVIHLGVDPTPYRENAGSAIELPSYLRGTQFLLYVGGIDTRKNIVGLLHDFIQARSRHPNLHLVLVGKEFLSQRQLDDLGWSKVLQDNPGTKEAVHITGYLPDGELAILYANAAAFVFPSLYEGFGLPVLEAMREGCPVIARNNSSIPEVVGDAALLVEDSKSMAPAIDTLLTNASERARLVQLGHARVIQFPWSKTSRELIAAIKTLPNAHS